MEEEKLKGGIYITPKDIQVLSNCSIRTARQEHLNTRKALKIPSKKLTIKAYCDYWKLDYNTVISYINPYR